MEGWNHWIGKRVYLELKRGRTYSGVIVRINASLQNDPFISLKDKYGKEVVLSISEIKLIQEEEKR